MNELRSILVIGVLALKFVDLAKRVNDYTPNYPESIPIMCTSCGATYRTADIYQCRYCRRKECLIPNHE